MSLSAKLIPNIYREKQSSTSRNDTAIDHPTAGKWRAVFAVLALVPSLAFADVFVDVGQSKFESLPDGSLWQQQFAGYPANMELKSRMWRAGVDVNGFRLSYADLGKYQTAGEASNDEQAVIACVCRTGPTQWYYTAGSMRGFFATYKAGWNGLFLEAGPGWYRQSFDLRVGNGYRYTERLWGIGYVVGAGVEYKNVSIGYYVYRNKISGEFNNSEFPAGIGEADVLSIGVKF